MLIVNHAGNTEYSTVQYSTVQYSTVQYSTVQYSTVQYCTVQCTDLSVFFGCEIPLDFLIKQNHKESLVNFLTVNYHINKQKQYKEKTCFITIRIPLLRPSLNTIYIAFVQAMPYVQRLDIIKSSLAGREVYHTVPAKYLQ